MKIVFLLFELFILSTQAADDACRMRSYGRGAGEPLNYCKEGLEKSGLLCYPFCSEGYRGVGPVCWKRCPAGFNVCGALCLKDKSCVGKLVEFGQTAWNIGHGAASKVHAGPVAMVIGAIPGTIELVKELPYSICA